MIKTRKPREPICDSQEPGATEAVGSINSNRRSENRSYKTISRTRSSRTRSSRTRSNRNRRKSKSRSRSLSRQYIGQEKGKEGFKQMQLTSSSDSDV